MDSPAKDFELVEASINDLHAAVKTGSVTVTQVVESYIARAKAFNGVSSMLVTADGASVDATTGVTRAGQELTFPTETIPVSDVLPDLNKYNGPSLEFGRMEETASKSGVHQQFGMIAGIPNAGQVNALSTINIRGERSVTCWGDYDRHPDDGPLPAGAPPVCEIFRRQPDALERARELDAEYGADPDLETLPMYGVVFSFKDPFDTRDMRSTGGADADYDIDFPARDHILVDQLRRKGAIIYAKAVNTEYNGRAGDPGGRHTRTRFYLRAWVPEGTWVKSSNPYDTRRAASLGSSSGSALSVSTNLVMASLGEETRASCRGPSNHNAVSLILPHKSMLGFDGGAIGADIYCDRSGIHGKTLADCALILDALKDADTGYYDPRDPFTTVPRSSVLSTPYSNHVCHDGDAGGLDNIRLGVIRESLVYPPGSLTEKPIVDAAVTEIKDLLGGHLGATLVESGDPLWMPDPDIEQMAPDFRRALRALLPVFMPDILFRLKADGTPLFHDPATIKPTEFAPGMVLETAPWIPSTIVLRYRKAKLTAQQISTLPPSSNKNFLRLSVFILVNTS